MLYRVIKLDSTEVLLCDDCLDDYFDEESGNNDCGTVPSVDYKRVYKGKCSVCGLGASIVEWEERLEEVATDISVLVGQVLTSIYKEEEEKEDYETSETLVFVTADGKRYRMYSQENSDGNDVRVTLEEIYGDFDDLLNTPILVAEEVASPPKDKDAEEDWTFYKFRTIKGSVTLRWHGTSNGYYSEKVNFEEYT